MKWMKKHKILTGCLLTFLLLIGLVLGYIWSKLSLIQYMTGNETDYSQESRPPEESQGQIVDASGLPVSQVPPPIPFERIEKRDDIVNILLLGTDERTRDFSIWARSDSMILISINKTDHTVKLVSLERGMGVPVLEGEHEGQYDWLTHIFQYGGADLVCKTVEHCFRIEIDHYVRINFTTVTSVVDAIGGIDVEMTGPEVGYLNTVYESTDQLFRAGLRVGMNHIDGTVALDYARLREIDSDWQRVERQRKVILAVVNQLKNSGLDDLDNLLNQVLPLIQTDMTMLEITQLMLYSPNFLKAEFDQMTIPREGTYGAMSGMGGRTLFAVDFEENSRILREFLYGETEKP